MKRNQIICCLSSFTFLLLFASCQNYYLARNIKPDAAKMQIDSLQNAGRYFVFHGNSQPVHMKNAGLLKDQNSLRFFADTLSVQHKLHLKKGRNGNFRYRKHDQFDSAVIQEVHVYAPLVRTSPGEEVTVPLNQVQKIEVLDIDKPRTRSSQTWGAIGYTLGLAAIFVGVAGAVAMSNWNWGSN